MSYSKATATSMLVALGFRVRPGEFAQVVRTFQGGYNLGAWLSQDGVCGPKTSAALAKSYANLKAGKSTASAHFSFREWTCTCRRRYSNCRTILVRRELLQSLEKYRARVGAPIRIVSGYRCPSRNAAVGGAKNSQHMYGAAVDVDYKLTYNQVKSLNAIAGIGKSVRTGKVRHLDRRDKGGNNTTGASVTRPTIWDYPE